MSASTFVYVTYIRVTPERLWHALTTPEIIKQYRFGMRVESEWNVGSTWRMHADGSLMDSGEILESVSPKRLVMSWLSEWRPEFRAEGDSRCVYEIEPTGASAKLTLTHSIERPDSKFIRAVSEGWPMVISNLKSVLETGRSEEHTSELQSQSNLVCRLLLEKKKKQLLIILSYSTHDNHYSYERRCVACRSWQRTCKLYVQLHRRDVTSPVCYRTPCRQCLLR